MAEKNSKKDSIRSASRLLSRLSTLLPRRTLGRCVLLCLCLLLPSHFALALAPPLPPAASQVDGYVAGSVVGSPLSNEQGFVQKDAPKQDQDTRSGQGDKKQRAARFEGQSRGWRFFESLRNFSLSASLRSAQRSLVRTLRLWQTPSDTVSGSYLALGYAEAQQEFPHASSIADRLAARLPTREVWERTFLAHVRAGKMEKALSIAERLQNQKDGVGFLARFLLASEALKDGKVARARTFVGDLSGFGDFARYGAPTYRFWLSFAQGDARGEQAALQEVERESMEDFARLLRIYAAFARGEFRITQQLLRETEPSSNDLSLLWVQALHHARSEQERGKQTALALLDPVKTQLRVQVLFLDELARRIEGDETQELVPAARGEGADEWALFFLARSLADLAMREANPTAKLLFARLATETDPSSSFARLVLSDALFDYRQDEEALSVAQQIPPRSLFYRQSVYLRAEILRRQDHNKEERLEESLALLKSLQELREDDLFAWWQAGSFLRVAEQPEKALLHFDKAVDLYLARAERLAPEVRSSAWRLYYERGIAFERAGRWDKAEQDFQTSLQLSPEQPMVMNYLAYTWLDLEKNEHYQKALSMLQRAVELRDKSGAVIDSLGWAYYRLKAYDDALQTLEQAIALAPEDPTINDHLGDVYWRVGRLLEARYQWSRVLAFEAEDKKLRQRVQKKLEVGLPLDIE